MGAPKKDVGAPEKALIQTKSRRQMKP